MVVNDYGFRIEDGLQRDLIGLFTFSDSAMKFHNFAMPMYIPTEKSSLYTCDGLAAGYISPKLTELFKMKGTFSFITDIKKEALEEHLPILLFGNSNATVSVKISRDNIEISRNGESRSIGSKTFNIRHLSFTVEYYETGNTTIKIYDLTGEQIDTFTISGKINNIKLVGNSNYQCLAKFTEFKLWSRILSDDDIKKNIALGDGKSQLILDTVSSPDNKKSPFRLEYDEPNNRIIFRENTAIVPSYKKLPYGTSVVLYNGKKTLSTETKLANVIGRNLVLYEMMFPSELGYDLNGNLNTNTFFEVKNYDTCKNITIGSYVSFSITKSEFLDYIETNKQITCGFRHYGYLFVIPETVYSAAENVGTDKIFAYKEYYESFISTTYDPSAESTAFILGRYPTLTSYKPIFADSIDIYYNYKNTNEKYIVPLYNIYEYNYTTNEYVLLEDHSSANYSNLKNTLPYSNIDLSSYVGKSLLIVVYTAVLAYDGHSAIAIRDSLNTVLAVALVKAVLSPVVTAPYYNYTCDYKSANIQINSSHTNIEIKVKDTTYGDTEINDIINFSTYKKESVFVYHKDKAMLKYQPSIFENESNNVCNASTYFNQYEHGNSAQFDKFDLLGSRAKGMIGNISLSNGNNGLYVNISNYPNATKNTVSSGEVVNFQEGLVFYDTPDYTTDGFQLVRFNSRFYVFGIYYENGIYKYNGSRIAASIFTNIHKIRIYLYNDEIMINGTRLTISFINTSFKVSKIFVPLVSFIHELYHGELFLVETPTMYGLIDSCVIYKSGDVIKADNENVFLIFSYDYVSKKLFQIDRAVEYSEFGRVFDPYSYKKSFPSTRFLRAEYPSTHDLLYMEKRIDALKVNITKNIVNDSISKKYYLLNGNEYIIENISPNISYYRSNQNPYVENSIDLSNAFYVTFINPISKKELSVSIVSYKESNNNIKCNMTSLGYYTTDNTAIISSSNIKNIVTNYSISQAMNEKVFHIGVAQNLVYNTSFDNVELIVGCTIQGDYLGDAIYVSGITMFQKSPIDLAYFEDNDIDEVKMITPSTTRIKYNNTIYNNISDITVNKDTDTQFEIFGYNGLYFYRNTDFYILKRRYINKSNLELRKSQVSKEIYLKKGAYDDIYYNNTKINEINVANISNPMTNPISIGKFESKYRKAWRNVIKFNNNSANIVVSDSYDYITLSKESYNMETNDIYTANTSIPKNKKSTIELCSIENNIVYIILCGYITCGEILLDNQEYNFPKIEYIDMLNNDLNILNNYPSFSLKGRTYSNINFFSKDFLFNKNGFTFSLIRNIDTIKILLDIQLPTNNIFIQSSKLSIVKSVSPDISFNSFAYSIQNADSIIYKADNNIIAKDDLKIMFIYDLGSNYNESNFSLVKNNNYTVLNKTDTLNTTSKNITYELIPLNEDGTRNKDLMSINNIVISFEKTNDVIRNVEIRKNKIAVIQNFASEQYGFKIINNNLEVADINNSTLYLYDGANISKNDNIDILFYLDSIIFNKQIEIDRYNIPIYDLEILASFRDNMIPTYFFDFYGMKYKEYDKISLKEKVSFGNVRGYKKIGISTDSIVFKNIKKKANRMEICISRQLYDIDKNIPIEQQETENFAKTKILINDDQSRTLTELTKTKFYKRYYIALGESEEIKTLQLLNFQYCDIMYIILYNSPTLYYGDILDENDFINIQIQDNEYIVSSASNYKWLETETYPTRLEIANGKEVTAEKPHFSYGKFKIMNVIENYPDTLFPFQKTYSIDNELYTNSIHNKTIENISVDPNFIDFNIFVQTIEDVAINNPILFVDDGWEKIDYSNVNHDYFYETDGSPKIKNVLFLIGEENESLDLYDSKSYLYKRSLLPYKPTNPMQLVIGSQIFLLSEILPATVHIDEKEVSNTVCIDGYKFQKGRVYINDIMSTIVDNHYEYEFCRTVKNISELISSYEFSNGCSNENSEIYKTKRDNGSIEISTDKYYLFNKFNSNRLHIDKGCAVYLYEGNKHMPILKDTMFIENIVSNIKLQSVSISLKSKMDFIYDIKVINYNTYENIDVLSCLRNILKPYFLYHNSMCRMSAASKTILEDISKITSINPLSYQTIGEIINAICSCGIFIWFNEIEQICIDYDVYNKNIYEYKNSLYAMLYENSPNAFNYINDTSYGVYGMKAIDKIDLNGYNYLENDIVITERDDLIINTYELTHENAVPMYDRNEYIIEDKIYPVNNINLESNNKTNNQEILEYQTNQLKPKLIELDVTKEEFNSMKLKTGVMCVVRRNNIDLSYKFIQANKI